jgi:hypothetical protein
MVASMSSGAGRAPMRSAPLLLTTDGTTSSEQPEAGRPPRRGSCRSDSPFRVGQCQRGEVKAYALRQPLHGTRPAQSLASSWGPIWSRPTGSVADPVCCGHQTTRQAGDPMTAVGPVRRSQGATTHGTAFATRISGQNHEHRGGKHVDRVTDDSGPRTPGRRISAPGLGILATSRTPDEGGAP